MKHFLSAFAALVLVGVASSCRDQNFDWDNAHANSAQEKFTDVFIKEFGKPAEGHQWGFDMAKIALGDISNMQSNMTRATRADVPDGVEVAPNSYFKQDENINNIRVYTMFGRPNSITKKEHDEVFAWFSNHKVEWEHTPVNYDYKDENDKYASRFSKEKSGDSYVENSDGKIRAYRISAENPDYGSLLWQQYRAYNHVDLNYASDNAQVVYVDDNNLLFRNAWIQNVAGDVFVDDPCTEGHLHEGNNCAKMNYIAFRSLLSTETTEYWVHAKDYNNPSTNESSTDGLNGGNGNWGWGNQPSQSAIDNGTAGDKSNAGLLLNADFNTLTFSCSLDNIGNRLHNKYYVVYLKGDGYEGYYLGLDLESLSSGDCDKNIPADGICNDWIIKIGDAGGFTAYQKIRIMCEDLGGFTGENVSKEPGRSLVSDIDYNDIVFDVAPTNNGKKIEITLQAAGGTLPLTVWYDNTPLFETHELFNSKHAICSDNDHYLSENDYKIMYNTSKGQSQTENAATAEPQKIELLFENENPTNGVKHYSFGAQKFSLDKLTIKVWRFSTNSYLNSDDYSTAAWVNLDNIKDEAPLKFCVPLIDESWKNINVKWLLEREAINKGYPNFEVWVGNPLKKFWEDPSKVVDTYLY